MSNSINAFITSKPAENHILFALLFFLNFEDKSKTYNIDTPISGIDEDVLVLAVSLMETILGIDVPDFYLTENKYKSLRQLATEIRAFTPLTDEAFYKKLKDNILSRQTVIARN